MRRAGPVLASWILCLATLVPETARTESTTPEALRGLLHVRSADAAGHGIYEIGGFTSAHTLVDTSGSRHYFAITHLQLGYGLSDYMEIGLALPLRAWHVSRSATNRIEPTSQLGFGDLEASGKLQVPLPWRRLRIGGVGSFTSPTGSRRRGFSTESSDGEAGGLLTLDLSQLERFPPTRLHANLTYRWNRNEVHGYGVAPLDSVVRHGFWPPGYPPIATDGKPRDNDQLVLRFATEFSTRILALFTEFSWEQFRYMRGLHWRQSPVYLTQGALLKFRNGLNLKAGVDLSLQRSDAPATVPHLPDWRFTLGLTWRGSLTLGDRDHDGIPDRVDKCPDAAEDFDGFQDEDGCPDPDNDGDGILDVDDKCPDLAEDFDGFQDEDGCPDMDNDEDGIVDALDRCPNEAEDFNGIEDTDGCPDAVGASQPTPTLALQFATGAADLPPDAATLLAPLVRELQGDPALTVELRAYTDTGGDPKASRDLSQRRAEAVRVYLIAQGIEPNRVHAVGMGAEQPETGSHGESPGRKERLEVRRNH